MLEPVWGESWSFKNCKDQQIQLHDRASLGKPREDMGLSHIEEGYNEANKILRGTHEKDMKFRRALIQDLENWSKVT